MTGPQRGCSAGSWPAQCLSCGVGIRTQASVALKAEYFPPRAHTCGLDQRQGLSGQRLLRNVGLEPCWSFGMRWFLLENWCLQIHLEHSHLKWRSSQPGKWDGFQSLSSLPLLTNSYLCFKTQLRGHLLQEAFLLLPKLSVTVCSEHLPYGVCQLAPHCVIVQSAPARACKLSCFGG